MKSSSVFNVYRDLRKQKRHVIATTVFGVLIHAVSPYVYIVFPAMIIEGFTAHANMSYIGILAVIAVTLQAICAVLNYWLENVNMENSDFAAMVENTKLTEKLYHVSYPMLVEKQYLDKVIQHRDEASREGSIFRKSLSVLETVLSSVISVMIVAVVLGTFWKDFFASVGPSFIESSYLGIVVIAGVVLSWFGLSTLSKMVGERNNVKRDEYGRINSIFEYYRNMITDYKSGKEIRLFKEQELILSHATQELINRGIPLQKRIAQGDALANGISGIVVSLLSFGVYLIVGVKANAGLFGIGVMAAYLCAFGQILESIRSISLVSGTLKMLQPRIERYYDILAAPEYDRHNELLEAVKNISSDAKEANHNIECRNLCFTYNNNGFQIKDINFSIHTGERIAVVGENGAGKTTFVMLLCGLLQPQSGWILLDGAPLESYAPEEKMRMISAVFQGFQIYALPVGENVAVNQNYDQQRVQHALASAGFPAKYNLETPLYKDLDENGVEISGGEAQKLALARALYKDTPFVLLDEPTSALDPYAEYRLYQDFDNMTKGKAAVFISHRMSSCRFCDKIAVFDNGRMVQFGTHSDLLAEKNGKYYELWSAQARYFQSDLSAGNLD